MNGNEIVCIYSVKQIHNYLASSQLSVTNRYLEITIEWEIAGYFGLNYIFFKSLFLQLKTNYSVLAYSLLKTKCNEIISYISKNLKN